MGFVTTNIDTVLENYFMQYGRQILTKMVTDSADYQKMTPVPNVIDKFSILEADVAELTQAYQKSFTKKGSLEFKPIINEVHKVKIDDTFTEADFDQKAILNFEITNGFGGEFTKDTARVQQVVMEWYTKKMREEDIKIILANGFRREPVAGTPGPAINSYDGYRTMLKKSIKSGSVPESNIFDTAWTEATATDVIEEFVEKYIDDSYWAEMDLQFYLSRTKFKQYKKDYRSEYGNENTFMGIEKIELVDDTDIVFAPMRSLSKSNVMFVTPKTNIFNMYNTSMGEYSFEADKRELALMIDWRKGTGFGIGGLIWVVGRICDAPSLLAPTPLAATTATIRWDVEPEATHYEVTLSAAADLSSPIQNAIEQAAQKTGDLENLIQTKAITGLTTATPYYFAIRSVIKVGGRTYKSELSKITSFTTA